MSRWTELRGEASLLRYLEMEARITVTFAVRKMVDEAFHRRIHARAEWSKLSVAYSLSGFILIMLTLTVDALAWLYPLGMSFMMCSVVILVGEAVGKHQDKPHYEALARWYKEQRKRQKA